MNNPKPVPIGRRRGFTMQLVIEEFHNDNNVPKVKLACGHVKTDPAWIYGNETSVKIRRLFQVMTNAPRKLRCYQCRKTEATCTDSQTQK